jgi:hypothetical protein
MFNCKKLLSLALAGAMAASLATSAFAASSESTTNRSLKVTGAYQAVTINVVVPTTGTVIINPYALPVEIGKDADGVAVKAENKQIVTKPLAIKNQSDIDLNVNVSTTTALTGSLKLATTAIADTDTSNSAYIYMAIEPTTITGSKDDVTEASYIDTYKGQTWTEPGDDVKNSVLLKSGTQSLPGATTLTKASYEDDGTFKEYASGSIAFIGFTGTCVTEPKTAWTTKDGLTCTVAFTFTPATTTEETTD